MLEIFATAWILHLYLEKASSFIHYYLGTSPAWDCYLKDMSGHTSQLAA